MMDATPAALVRPRLKAPRAAAIAGIMFSVLFIVGLVLVRLLVPADPLEDGRWLPHGGKIVSFALSLLPFAGIAFLWFMAVLRDRLGTYEDRFFDTVFLGSGFLFLAMLFMCAALASGIIMIHGNASNRQLDAGIYTFGRSITYQLMHIYAIKMAGVFMILTSMLSLRTGIVPRWMAILGFVLAVLLLLSVGYFQWTPLLFPLWVLMISVYVLFFNLKVITEN